MIGAVCTASSGESGMYDCSLNCIADSVNSSTWGTGSCDDGSDSSFYDGISESYVDWNCSDWSNDIGDCGSDGDGACKRNVLGFTCDELVSNGLGTCAALEAEGYDCSGCTCEAGDGSD